MQFHGLTRRTRGGDPIGPTVVGGALVRSRERSPLPWTNDCDLSDLTAVRFDPALVQTAAAVHT
jgi:hypothetical protein